MSRDNRYLTCFFWCQVTFAPSCVFEPNRPMRPWNSR